MNNLLLLELETQEERNGAVREFVDKNDVSAADLEDLASWILHGVKGVSVRRKIELSKHKGAL